MKNKNFLQSLKCSFNGIVAYFKSERNAKIEFVFAILAFALGIIFKLSKTEFAVLSITIFCNCSWNDKYRSREDFGLNW